MSILDGRGTRARPCSPTQLDPSRPQRDIPAAGALKRAGICMMLRARHQVHALDKKLRALKNKISRISFFELKNMFVINVMSLFLILVVAFRCIFSP
ncbi:hypothetical protein EXZ48_18360 [Shinella sp. JR1-6]|jgi:hypothetical protein|nr:hypothetical protein EXZ48_18360 [Shinella sp. JR1-6]